MNCAYLQKIKESEVPAPVIAKFQSLHPDVKDINWLKLKKGGYEAEHQHVFNSTGELFLNMFFKPFVVRKHDD
jgi:hypothetical protein